MIALEMQRFPGFVGRWCGPHVRVVLVCADAADMGLVDVDDASEVVGFVLENAGLPA